MPVLEELARNRVALAGELAPSPVGRALELGLSCARGDGIKLLLPRLRPFIGADCLTIIDAYCFTIAQ